MLAPCLALASLALGMEEAVLAARWLEHGVAANQLRLAKYRPRAGTEPQLLYGEHTDYDGLTFLWRNRSNGLQVQIGEAWVEVPVLVSEPGALLVNLADLMEVWTRGVWHSPRHRVRRTVLQGQEEELLSIVWFTGPHPSTPLLPLPSPLVPRPAEGEEVVTAGDHVLAKIARTANKPQEKLLPAVTKLQ